MTILIDSSVWINIFLDKTGAIARTVRSIVRNDEVALTRFNQLELLQGSSNARDWTLISDYLDGQDNLDANPNTWRKAASIFFELRTRGRKVRSTIDCCIAQIAIEHRALLLHDNLVFESIADIRPLLQCRT